MEVTRVRAEWRSSTEAPGAPCVMTAGTSVMPMWSAGSWAVAGPCQLQEMPGLVRAQDPLSWMTCAAQGMSPICGAVPTVAGSPTTVGTVKTLVSSAQVGLQGCGLSLLGGVWSGIEVSFCSDLLTQSCFYFSWISDISLVLC